METPGRRDGLDWAHSAGGNRSNKRERRGEEVRTQNGQESAWCAGKKPDRFHPPLLDTGGEKTCDDDQSPIRVQSTTSPCPLPARSRWPTSEAQAPSPSLPFAVSLTAVRKPAPTGSRNTPNS
ncbi:hypothetical protein CPLU01_08953 [Colletotrichum plurivorum]|uniref:Uncharacterized protein n=1 Tax=Colletotrichum plurivorum TaxID=2175906 RepID=A0A8H6NCL6_9PEZI|nr:hypothetical protein CPLU01_08953 [Colletotrichum plurivorum]